jgi:molybdopterin-guanine dinucleotide biosynthesis protein
MLIAFRSVLHISKI